MGRDIVYELKRKCGKPNCRCTRGELHRSPCLSYYVGGDKRKLTTLKEHQTNTKYNFTYFLLDIEIKILLYAKKQHISPDGLFLPTRFFLPVFNLSSK